MHRRLARTLAIALALSVAPIVDGTPLVAVTPARAGATLSVVTVKAGLNAPSAFTFAPNGHIWYLERLTGRVKVLNPATDHERLFVDITAVSGVGERGALGIALHPDWPDRPFVYVYVTRTVNGRTRNQMLRFRSRDGRAGRRRVLLSIAAGPATNHNGGRILFGPGGRLYIVVGDNANPANSQDLTGNLRGKILRVDPDGSVPASNPFGRIWAFGIRNSFGFAFDPETNDLWETDNGPECNDEINRIATGGNHAWGPNEDCSSGSSPTNTNNSGPAPRILPEHWFADTFGITGVAFCDACGLGAAFDGTMLYGGVNPGNIRRSTLSADRTTIVGTTVVVPDRTVHSMEVGPNGRVYFSDGSGIYRLAP